MKVKVYIWDLHIFQHIGNSYMCFLTADLSVYILTSILMSQLLFSTHHFHAYCEHISESFTCSFFSVKIPHVTLLVPNTS